MQRFHGLLHQAGLVNIRQAHIHIQHLCAAAFLIHGLRQNIIHIALPQSLLKALFARGVDSLAHHGDIAHIHGFHGGTQQAALQRLGILRGLALGDLCQIANVLRRCAAAAAQHANAQRQILRHGIAEHFGGDIIARAIGTGQARVRLDKHREVFRHALAKALGQRQDLHRAKAAVDAHGIRAKAHGGGGKAFHGAARKAAAVLLKAHGNHHRQGAVFLCGQNSCFYFIQIGHGFHHDHIGLCACDHDLLKAAVGILKFQCARRLQQLAQGAHIQRHQRTRALHGPACAGKRSRDHLGHTIAAALQLFGRGAKGVGVYDIRTGLHILAVDAGKHFRLGDA